MNETDKQNEADSELSPREAAEILGLATSTLSKWRSTQEKPELPWNKRFKYVFYLKSDVLRFKELNTRTSASSETYI